MSHGAQCDCMVCSIGKKMGMIKGDNHPGHNHNHEEGHSHGEEKTCPTCHAPLQENGTCATCSVS